MKRVTVSGWAMLAAVAACVVIPASAQVPPPDRGGNGGDAPHYVDSADYDPQPYYVDGVQYKPYVPEKKKAKPAAEAVKPAPTPVTPTDTPIDELHPFVPQQTPAKVAQAEASSKSASASEASASSYAPQKRARYAVAIIEALDKVTAESVRFEAPIGKPIRYKGLIYTVKACETTAEDEPMSDAMAYIRVRTNPTAATNTSPAIKSKEVFRGWTFASTPSLNPIQHPVYDAWVISCRQPLVSTAS
jgi:hypothetical protein